MNKKTEPRRKKNDAGLKKQLAEKTFQLKIESALEKVRTVAMKMKKPADMLSICKTISIQLEKLGVKEIRNIQTAIFYPDRGTYMNYQFYAKHNKTFITDTVYTNHKVSRNFANKMLKGKGQFSITHIKGRKKLKDWITYQKSTNVFIDKYLHIALSLSYYWYSLGPVALGISTYKPLTENEEDLFKRFMKVFELAYRRYLDIEKAEAQAREAQIEASLERVRVIAMGLSKPDDLMRICETMFHELKKLGFNDLRNAMINIHYDDKKYLLNYDYAENTGKTATTFVYHSHPIVDNIIRHAKKSGDSFTEMIYSGKALNELRAFRKKNGEKDDVRLNRIDALYYYFYSTGTGALGISMFKTANPEQLNILKRFRNVFDLAYGRYTDIEKAEAQAREGQIQLALERVRARTMAMQHSPELLGVIKVVSQQLQQLNFRFDHVSFGINNQAQDYHFWTAMANMLDPQELHVSYIDNPVFENIRKAQKEQLTFFTDILTPEENNQWTMHMLKCMGEDFLSKDVKSYIFNKSIARSVAISPNIFLITAKYKPIPYSEEDNDILKRFGQAFDQSYTRFLDLQKAEAQTREAQIEAALERVRAKAMAMHASHELKDVAREMRNQISLLGQKQLETCAIHLWDESSGHFEGWAALRSPDNTGEIIESESRLDIKGIRILEESFQKYLAGEKDYVLVNDVARAKEFFGALKTVDIKAYEFLAPTIKNKKPDDICAYWSVSDFPGGSLVMVTMKLPDEDSRSLLRRFANVFGLAYQRYLDIKKAETQARESQIQLALERVRSRSMAMHKSDELKEVIRLVLEQFVHLKINVEHAGFYIDYKAHDDMHIWLADPNIEPFFAIIPYFDTPTWNSFIEAKKNGTTFHTDLLEFEEKNKFYQSLFKLFAIPEEAKEFYLQCKGLAVSTVLLDNVGLYIENFSAISYTDEENKILMRFGNVFQQTYTRFLDLQKAEAQAREAQIEAALERVRAHAMAMHRSDELSDVLAVLFEQFDVLNIRPVDVHLDLFDLEKNTFSYRATGKEGKRVIAEQIVDLDSRPEWQSLVERWKKGKPNTVDFSYYPQEVIRDLMAFFPDIWASMPLEAIMVPEIDFPDGIYDALGYCKFGFLGFHHNRKTTEEENRILIRFANEFERLYQRFLDLQKAEVQAKEAQIEAALERVRSKAMAMHKTEDINDAVTVVFEELDRLDLGIMRCGIARMHTENWMTQLWTIAKSDDGNSVLVSGEEPMDIHPLLIGAYTSWQDKKEEFSYDLAGDDLIQYYKIIGDTDFKLPQNLQGIHKDNLRQYFYAAYFDSGGLFAFREEPFTDEAKKVVKRFANVFKLTYKRFLDLQKAEAQAREAKIEAALEKVRSRTLAMQHSDELAETAAVLFQQLIHLGIEPNRLYIGIAEDNYTDIEFWITDEDGSKVSTMFKGDATKNISMKKMVDAWKEQQKSVVIDMQGKELDDYFHYLGEELHVPFKGGLSQKRRLQYIAYFSKGFIGMASPDEQPAETLQLLERFAYVFNLTFTRFNDLKLAEAHALQAEQDLIEIKAARKKAEDTLTELQAAQKQLIQSEKMASLGELTAGIAHEIQNPLNFVNNFSEVSNELIDEMNEELDKGEIEEAKAIATDIKQNLEKINHHGKRADGIVKGMLQHSRSSSGQKESTDINALCDEYLRLAFHGLRAKDKSFNAKFETDFDNTIEKINIVPQDIGRVILNLINNAFYAVSEKAKQNIPDYEPTVTVKTSKNPPPTGGGRGAFVEIRVSDNGNGIPEAIKEKIFQPFFTTKPTGSGTGLGLSLSYDIIKAHGGEIKVETKEGEGTEFIIQLPVV